MVNKVKKRRLKQPVTDSVLLASIVESSDDAIFTKNPQGLITSWNKGAERIYGYKAADILGKTPAVLLPHGHEDEFPRIMERIKRGERVELFEAVRRTKDGRLIDVALNVSPIKNARGRVVGAATIARDISERKKADQRFRLAVEASPNAMIMVGKNGRIVLVNAQAETLFGYSHGELSGRSIESLIPARFQAQHPRHRESFSAAPQARPMGAGRELFGLRKNGTEMPVEVGLNPVETAEGLLVLTSIVDITERKKLQRQNELEILNKELEVLLAITSHDFREPLRSIETFSHMVHDEYAERLGAEGQDLLRRIVRAAERLRRLIDDVSSLAQARKVSPLSDTIEIDSILKEVLARLEETVSATGAKVRAIQPLPRIAGDATWVTQALYNLVSNALKFTAEGRPADVEVAPYRGPRGEVGIEVRDRGPGVKPADSERIFRLFQRAVGRDVDGTGAGLAIVHAVAERHGGRAWVEPREGGGSQFIITFGPGGTL